MVPQLIQKNVSIDLLDDGFPIATGVHCAFPGLQLENWNLLNCCIKIRIWKSRPTSAGSRSWIQRSVDKRPAYWRRAVRSSTSDIFSLPSLCPMAFRIQIKAPNLKNKKVKWQPVLLHTCPPTMKQRAKFSKTPAWKLDWCFFFGYGTTHQGVTY